MTSWEIPQYFKDNYHRISLKLFENLANDAEKCLAETTKAGNIITTRSQWGLALSFAALLAILGFLGGGESQNSVLNLAAKLMVIILLTSIFFLVKAFWQYKICAPGHPPSLTFNDCFTKNLEGDFKNQERLYLINKSRDIENGIKYNDSINSKRWKDFKWGISIAVVSPFVSLALSYLFFSKSLLTCLY